MARQLSQILRWFGGPKRWFILAAGDGLLVGIGLRRMPTEIGVHGVVRLVQSLACNGVELKRVRFIGHQTLQSSNRGAVLKA